MRELLAAAETLGQAPPAVEAALVLAGGDTDMARWELRQQARCLHDPAAAASEPSGAPWHASSSSAAHPGPPPAVPAAEAPPGYAQVLHMGGPTALKLHVAGVAAGQGADDNEIDGLMEMLGI